MALPEPFAVDHPFLPPDTFRDDVILAAPQVVTTEHGQAWLSEGSIGWVPYFLERAETTVRQHGVWTNLDFGGMAPTEIFRKHFIACFIEDDFGIENRHHIGIDNICRECDYPHSDCLWPESPEELWRGVKNLPKDEIDRMTHINVMRDFSYDPFALLGRENCTVGALRALARAKGVDTIEMRELAVPDAPPEGGLPRAVEGRGM